MNDMPIMDAARKAGNATVDKLFDEPSHPSEGDLVSRALPRASKDDLRPWWKRGGPFLHPEEEWALARRWRYRSDRAAADRVIKAHLPLIAKCAAKFPSLRHDEAMSAGCL